MSDRLRHKIDVMEDALRGMAIEVRHKDDNSWVLATEMPAWNWLHYEYRVARSAPAQPLTDAERAIAELYAFLVGERPDIPGLLACKQLHERLRQERVQ